MKRICVSLFFLAITCSIDASEQHVYQVYDLEKNEFMISIVGKIAVPEKFTLDVNNLSQYESSILSGTKIGLERKKDSDYQKWLEDQEVRACYADACALLMPMAVGGGLATYVATSIMAMGDDFMPGACLTGCFGCVPCSIILANKCADRMKFDQSRILATLALLEIELAKRKEKME